MDRTSSTKPVRDFTDIAIWRGSLAAVLVGYVLTTLMIVWTASGFDTTGLANIPQLVNRAVATLLSPASLITVLSAMGIVLVIGFFVMASYKGDHTTFRAAAIIGARTAGIGIAILLVYLLILGASTITSAAGFAGFVQLAITMLPLLPVGALTGLAGRLAAGPPTLTRDAPRTLTRRHS